MYAITGDSLDIPFAQAEAYSGRLFNEVARYLKS
jgi:hypothetical protein